jgi:hypothetical protein
MPKNYNAIFDYNLFWPAEYDPSMTYYRQLNFLFEKVQELEARVAELEGNSRTPDRTKTHDITTEGAQTRDITTRGH